jgi:hypothetical protein
MRDHSGLKITQFNGLFDRGDDEVVPVDHFLSCQNLMFTSRGFETRDGSSLDLTKANIRRIAIFRLVGQAQRLLILDNSGNIYDSTNLTVSILHVVGMTDFSVVSLFNRAYITPHDGITGLAGEKVYVYEGSPTTGARAACGLAPTGFTLGLANSGVSGKVEAGVHAIAACYQTSSGFITGPGGYATITATGARKLDISTIPLGPSYVTARVLIGTKIITDFDGNFVSQTWFFIPNGTINNNTATTLTVDFYDSELLDSADYLLDQLSSIPAGVTINSYKGRLISAGENLNQSLARVSKAGEPEQFDATEGFFSANPGDAGSGIKNIWTHRDALIVQKSQRSYICTGTDDNAVFWHVDELDMSVGAEPHSVATILDFGQTIEDYAVVADRMGLRLFNGSFSGSPLTYDIDDYWKRINKAAFNTVEVCLDPINCVVYVAIPIDGATHPNVILMGDFNSGIEPDKIKWCPWIFPDSAQSIVVDTNNSTKEPVLKMGFYSGNVYKLDSTQTNDFGTAIDHWTEFALLPHETDEGVVDGIYHFAGVSFRARGTGSLDITLRDQDSVHTLTALAYSLTSSPGMDCFRQFNFKGQKCAIKFRHQSINSQIFCTKMTLLATPLWSEVPS